MKAVEKILNFFRKNNQDVLLNKKAVAYQNTVLEQKSNKDIILKAIDKLQLSHYFEFEVIQNDKLLSIETIDCALISGFAIWSGGSYEVSKRMLHQIKTERCRLKVYLIDLDNNSEELQAKLFTCSYHGYFESCFVHKGHIISRYKHQSQLDFFIETVKKEIGLSIN